MKYPKIYSLSTVGIVKHYNQDYLIHPDRTDFTGNNGVGKSILADLLQLIFISDDNLIEFGTDSMDQDGRSAYTLPKGTSEGYAFINIEIESGRFITIGVCIPNKRSKRLKPFVILKHPDLDKHIDELSFTATELPRYESFIRDGEFLGIEQQARHFRDSHSLYLQYFVHNEDKNRYYSFLYKKEILSINLSIKNNLKSFAKIIQSFSRAKTLNIKNSQNLKDFLFEESEKDFRETFATYKAELETQLFEYKGLESDILLLESKQQSLENLKEIEKKANLAHLNYFRAKLRSEEFNVVSLQLKYDKEKETLATYENQYQRLISRVPRLASILLQLQNDEAALKGMIEAQTKYLSLQEVIDKHSEELESISKCDAPDIGHLEEHECIIGQFHTDEILKKIAELKGVHESYGSLPAMSDKVTEQKKVISQHRIALENELKKNIEILALINYNQKDTLFSRVLEENQTLSEKQEAVLFELLSTSWNKPEKPISRSTYTENLSLLDEENIIHDISDGGYWLSLGHLKQFIPKLERPQLFKDQEKLSEVFAKRREEITILSKELERQLDILDKFEKGLLTNISTVIPTYSFDSRLKDFSAYQHFEKTAWLIDDLVQHTENITKKIQLLKDEQELIEFPIRFGERKSAAYYQMCWDRINDRIMKCRELIATENTRITSLREELIPVKTNANENSFKDLETLKEKYNQTLSDFCNIYGDEQLENIRTIVVNSTIEIDLLQKSFTDAQQDYISEYKVILSRFNENTDGDKEIREQIKEERYSFHILELALLGPQILYTDNIAEKMRELNRIRLGIVEAIFETMLKIFVKTKDKYETYRQTIKDLNTFFKKTKISKKYYFQIHFLPHTEFSVDWIYQLQNSSTTAHKIGEFAFSDTSIEQFVEDFFKTATSYRRKINFSELLDPKTYFSLNAKLENETGDKETPGSTGETYAAIVLLGIGRLSIVQTNDRKGIKFIILEETANLDTTNFSTFPELAEEHGYQIITMTPKPYGSDASREWILHHLIPGLTDTDINFPVSNSYFKTGNDSIALQQYLNKKNA